ncbi:MAG TPA: tRNA lysidine(34) synthetase TilS [Phycisphaerales bacterium]|nr:tRNA lysidine(34) synthetase TilS [Phycisphaerales bacterium]
MPAGRLSRNDPAVRRVLHAWRRLTSSPGSARVGSGAPTLVACSGGADSTALALVLAAGGARIVLGHVVHDLRPGAQAEADRDAVAALARHLGVGFCEGLAAARAAGGNLEAGARRLRYAVLRGLAAEQGMGFVATAHHAGDQLESVLMGLLRGAGPRGLAGMPARRLLRGPAPAVRLIRPMLRLEADEPRRLCRVAGLAWREDETNLDVSRLRSAVRHQVVPALEAVRPGAARRAAMSATLLRDAAAVVRAVAGALPGNAGPPQPVAELGRNFVGWRLAREDMRAARGIVVGEAVRLAARRLGLGLDSLGADAVEPVVRAARDVATEPRRFGLGRGGGLVVLVTAREVVIAAERRGERAGPGPGGPR